jgi:hypothetical protein
MEVGQKKGKGGLGSADWERMRREGMEREEATLFASCVGEV